MSFNAGAITARLVLDTSGFTASATDASRKVQQFGQNIVSTTRQISRAASTMTFLGAGITAPLILAFKSAEKYSNSVREEMARLNNAIIQFRVSIAESLLPIMHRFSNAIADLVQRWQSLSSELRESMLRTALLTGVFLTLAGVISTVILKVAMLSGYLIKLAGDFMVFAMLHPELLLIRLAIVGIVFAMFKWKEVGDIVMNTFQILFDMAKIGLNSILYLANSIASAFFVATTGALKLAAAINLNKEAKKTLEDLASGAWKLAQQYSKLADTNLKNISDAGKSTWDTLITGQSDFSRGFESLKEQAAAWIDLFKGLGGKEMKIPSFIPEASKTFAQGWRDATTQALADLSNFGNMAATAVQGLVSGMQSSFSTLFQGLFKGSIASFSEFMTSIGDLFLKTISDMIAQLMVLWIWQQITGLMSFGSGTITGGVGGAITNTAQFGKVWSPSFAEGTDSIPYSGIYRLHEGEKVTPKYDAAKSDAIELTIVNQITPEAVAAAMSGKEGKGVIINTINTDSLRNGPTRKTIRSK